MPPRLENVTDGQAPVKTVVNWMAIGDYGSKSHGYLMTKKSLRAKCDIRANLEAFIHLSPKIIKLNKLTPKRKHMAHSPKEIYQYLVEIFYIQVIKLKRSFIKYHMNCHLGTRKTECSVFSFSLSHFILHTPVTQKHKSAINP